MDRYLGYTPHHKNSIQGKKYKNFVKGDIAYLPFRENVFDQVFASHVIEHLLLPINGLKELKRVAKTTIIKVPNNPQLNEHSKHLYSWSKTSLKNLLNYFWEDVEVLINMPFYTFNKSRLLKLTSRFPLIHNNLLRFIGNRMGLELLAVCKG